MLLNMLLPPAILPPTPFAHERKLLAASVGENPTDCEVSCSNIAHELDRISIIAIT
jgi:hypothetical protein